MHGARSVVLAGLLLSACCVAGCDDDDPDAAPGEVVDDEPVDLGGGVTGRRIRYGSVGVDGEPSEVGGLLAVPEGDPPAGGWPVVAYAHATTGGGDECAPSEDPSLALVGQGLGALVDAGYVAVATDYEGIGTSGAHPYLNGGSEAQAIVDSVRAARELVPEATEQWAVMGHSQGGHAALFTAELGPELAPELDLVGSVAQAPVTDVASLTDPETPLGRTFIVLFLAGYLEVSGVDEDDLLTAAGEDAVDEIEDQCELAPLDVPLVRRGGALEDAFAYEAEQVPGEVGTSVPVLVQQGDEDPLVLPETAEDYVARACAGGTTVSLAMYPGVDHLEVVDAGQADALAWIADRFAGAAAPSSCNGS